MVPYPNKKSPLVEIKPLDAPPERGRVVGEESVIYKLQFTTCNKLLEYEYI